MMDAGAVRASVVVVSRHRTPALLRCLAALRQQTHPLIEVIVVADPAAIASLHGQTDIKRVSFDLPNISAARNLGLAQAAGEVVLFIDDDAVAEPTWAARLCAAFAAPHVVAATGFVRGRNGISFQWRACEVDHLGQDHPLDVPQSPSLHIGTAQRAVKTQGTNAAFRTDALRAIGGFDAGFAFYLDEADVNLRLCALGQTAIVPDAQVHHGYLQSARRSARRIPLSLFDIGASTAVFLRKHGGAGATQAGRAQLFSVQSARIARLRSRLTISKTHAVALLDSLAQGFDDGMARSFGALVAFAPPPPFLPLCAPPPRAHMVISGWFFQAAELHRRAKIVRQTGAVVTVICLSFGLRPHKMQFLPCAQTGGYWWQSGGIWGRAVRSTAAKLQGFTARIAAERARIAPLRDI
jgi:O-antigen biosynthesis protein